MNEVPTEKAFIQTMEMILAIHEEPEPFFEALVSELIALDTEGLSNLRTALMSRHEQAVMVEIENTQILKVLAATLQNSLDNPKSEMAAKAYLYLEQALEKLRRDDIDAIVSSFKKNSNNRVGMFNGVNLITPMKIVGMPDPSKSIIKMYEQAAPSSKSSK